jgi:hypothetical protein
MNDSGGRPGDRVLDGESIETGKAPAPEMVSGPFAFRRREYAGVGIGLEGEIFSIIRKVLQVKAIPISTQAGIPTPGWLDKNFLAFCNLSYPACVPANERSDQLESDLMCYPPRKLCFSCFYQRFAGFASLGCKSGIPAGLTAECVCFRSAFHISDPIRLNLSNQHQ